MIIQKCKKIKYSYSKQNFKKTLMRNKKKNLLKTNNKSKMNKKCKIKFKKT
jgi:hypothetical protein